jgi:hypothetical protein
LTDKAHSISQRLLNISKDRNEEYTFILSRYGTERLLYRISLSPKCKGFMLKGASLFLAWFGHAFRTTRDIDLLGDGPSDLESIKELFRELSRMDTFDLDGLSFQEESIQAQRIKEGEDYEGVRVKMRALLGRSRIDIQVDIGFGDAVTPAPERVTFPVLLDAPAPTLLAYPVYTAMAEKFNAMVTRDMANSRMKDFYDLVILFRTFDPQVETLAKAIERTFARRRTAIPSTVPVALTEEFAEDEMKKVQWKAFVNKSRLAQPMGELGEVVAELRRHFTPVLRLIAVDV